MKSTKEKTLQKVFLEFLAEQQSVLKPQSYSGNGLAINYFERYLNGYGSENMTEEELERYEKLSEGKGKEYCEIFGPRQLGLREMENFLGRFMVLRVEASKNFLTVVGRVMHKLVKWMHEKGYMADDDYEAMDKRVKELKADLPIAVEVNGLMSAYAAKSQRGKYKEELKAASQSKKLSPENCGLRILKTQESLKGLC